MKWRNLCREISDNATLFTSIIYFSKYQLLGPNEFFFAPTKMILTLYLSSLSRQSKRILLFFALKPQQEDNIPISPTLKLLIFFRCFSSYHLPFLLFAYLVHHSIHIFFSNFFPNSLKILSPWMSLISKRQITHIYLYSSKNSKKDVGDLRHHVSP